MLLRLILFAIGFYYLFKFLSRFFGGFMIKKAQEHYNQNHYQQPQYNRPKEGEIKLTYKPKDNKQHVKGGDYVDFEEIE